MEILSFSIDCIWLIINSIDSNNLFLLFSIESKAPDLIKLSKVFFVIKPCGTLFNKSSILLNNPSLSLISTIFLIQSFPTFLRDDREYLIADLSFDTSSILNSSLL